MTRSNVCIVAVLLLSGMGTAANVKAETTPTALELHGKYLPPWGKVQTFVATAEEDYYVETPDQQQLDLKLHFKHKVIFDHARIYYHVQELNPSGNWARQTDTVSVLTPIAAKKWNKNLVGPGTGYIDFENSKLADEIRRNVAAMCPWRDPRQFGFDPPWEQATVMETVSHNGESAYKLKWSLGSDYMALLTKDALLPVLVEVSYQGKIDHSGEVTLVQKVKDIVVPSTIIYRTWERVD